MHPLRLSATHPALRFVRRRPRTAIAPRPHPRRCLLVGLVVLAAGLLLPPAPLRAAGVVGTGTPTSCTEAAFDTARAGGGLVTFNCGSAAHTIELTSEKRLTPDTTIDGGGSITLSGVTATPLVSVGSGTTVELHGLTIDGLATVRDGAVIRNDGTLQLDNTEFRNNWTASGSSGGAIASSGTLTVINSVFVGNRGGSGGAIYATPHSVTTISGSTFQLNEAYAADGRGGAVLIDDGARVTVQDSWLGENRAHAGGALYNGGSATITGGAIGDNDAEIGGALVNAAGGSATITGSMFSINTTTSGGAIVNVGGVLAMDGAAVVENRVLTTGGMIQTGSSGTRAGNSTVSNTTISGNRGDAVELNGNASVRLTNVTIANNAGGVVINNVGSTLTLVNVLLANTGPNCAGPLLAGAIRSGFNLSDDASCSLSGTGDRSDTDAALAPLADNGGETTTHLPLAGSPAIDGGTTAGCPVRDQRGVARPQGASCDIGAVEVGLPPAASPSPSPALTAFRALLPLVQR